MRRLLVAAGACALLLAVTTASAFGQRMDRARAGRLLRRPHQDAQFIVKFRDRLPEAEDVAAWAGTRVRGVARRGLARGSFTWWRPRRAEPACWPD